tara:strand:+ start:374 stop:1585 length:1212 start_codon:yes stop_codon:yes gene_type:complete
MTYSLIADSITACEITLPEEKKKSPSIFKVELRAKDTGVFKALFERLSALSDHIHVAHTHAEMDSCPLNNGGVAIFYYETEASAKKLNRNLEIIKESVRSVVVKGLMGVPEPLQAVMDAYDLGDAYADYVHEVKAVDMGAGSSIDVRAQEIADKKRAEDKDYAEIDKRNYALLSDEAYTFEDEIKAIVATVIATFDGIDDEKELSNLISVVAMELADEFKANRIIEEHVTLYTDIALEQIIDEVGEIEPAQEMAAYKLEKAAINLIENNKRSAVIRNSWKQGKNALGKVLNVMFANASHKHGSSPVCFTGVDIGCLVTQPFGYRLQTAEFERIVSMHEASEMDGLAGAIVAQLSGFIELKRGQVLKGKRHQLAKDLVAQYEEQGKIPKMDIYQRILDDTKSVF